MLSSESLPTCLELIAQAAGDKTHVKGLTHKYYRYPARFSPVFAKSVISEFTKPGDLIVDPFMGGGTSLVEAISAGRNAIGIDLNSLAQFVSSVKTTILNQNDIDELSSWFRKIENSLSLRGF